MDNLECYLGEDIRTKIYKRIRKRELRASVILVCILVLSTHVGAFCAEFLFQLLLSLFPSDNTPLVREICDMAVYTVQMCTPIILFFAIRKKGFSDIFNIEEGLCIEGGSKEELSFGALFSYFVIGMFASLMLAIFSDFFTNGVSDFLSLFSENMALRPEAYDLPMPEGDSAFSVNVFTASVLAAVLEEIVFRGILMSELMKYGKTFAIVTSAFFFCSVHGSAEQMVYSFSCGIIFGIIAVKTGSVTLGILIHLLNNAYTSISEYIMTYYGGTGFELLFMLIDIAIITLGLVCFIYKICKGRFDYYEREESEKSPGELTAYETFSVFVSPIMFVYYIFVIVETYGVYFMYNNMI